MMSIVNESNLQSQNFAISPFPNFPGATTKRRGRGSLSGSNPAIQSPNLRSSVEILSNANSTPFLELLLKVREGLQYFAPELCTDGVNGTYFLKDKRGENIAIFKPQDEDGNSQNNPKLQSLDAPLDHRFPTGKAVLREVAASLLDRERFYDVPKTRLVKICYGEENNRVTKIGSLQEYIVHDFSSEEYGYKEFSINDVHKIGILDIQMLNLDRHAGNILIKKLNNRNQESLKLIPIDHGFSLPDHLNCSWFEWMNWPQAKIPFDDDVKSYIMRIDLDRDAHMLQFQLGIEPECIRTMQVTVTLLKKAVQLEMTLYDIGLLVCRPSEDETSPLEKMWTEAQEKFRAQLKKEMHEPQTSFSMIKSVDRPAIAAPRLDVFDFLSEIIAETTKKSKSAKKASK